LKALELVRNKSYDICLLDISMPEMDGIETAKRIIQAKPDQKIIILTTYNDKQIISEAVQAGARGYLLKNSSKGELIQAIEDVVKGEVHFHNKVQNVVTSGYVELLAKQQTRPEVELTQREEEIVKLLAREYTNDKIAETLNISYRTVETHRKNMMQKTNSHNLAGLLKYAYTHGIIK